MKDIIAAISIAPEINAATIAYCAHLMAQPYADTLRGPEAMQGINSAHSAARLRGHPLEFSMEPE